MTFFGFTVLNDCHQHDGLKRPWGWKHRARRYFSVGLSLLLVVGLLSIAPASWAEPNQTNDPTVVASGQNTPNTAYAPLDRNDFYHLDLMEEAVFSQKYPDAPVGERLDRLEKTVLGSVQYQIPPKERLIKLHHILKKETVRSAPTPMHNRAQQPSGFTPSSSTSQSGYLAGHSPAGLEQEKNAQPRPVTQNSQAASGMDYPVVDQIEQKVMGRVFVNDSLETRLNRLDSDVFGFPQSGSYAARVDHLRFVVLGDSGNGVPNSAQTIGSSGYGQTQNSYAGWNNSYSSPGQGQGNQNLQMLEKAEQDTFSRTYPYEPIENRLDRLEMQLFNRTSPQASVDDRIERVAAVSVAQSAPPSEYQPTITNSYAARKSTLKSLWPIIPIIILSLL